MLYLDMVQGRTCSAARITSTCVRKRRGRSLARSLSRTLALANERTARVCVLHVYTCSENIKYVR